MGISRILIRNMKATFLPLLILATSLIALAEGPYTHEGDAKGYLEHFHRCLHYEERPELYLVCNFALKAQPRGTLSDRGWEEFEITCTVVDPIKGTKKIGEQFKYRRYLDGKASQKHRDYYMGKLLYVFITRHPDGHLFVDPQDPSCAWPYSEELQKAANLHRKPKAKNDKKQENPK